MSIVEYGIQDRQLTPRERWICFSALFFFGFIAAFNLFKAPPVLGFIAQDLMLSPDMVGMIMTSYSICALVFAFPGMWIMQKLGVKFSVILSGVIMLLGTLIICFSADTATFMIGRALEGCAYGLICVIGPNIMVRLFPLKNQGLCMGIWSQWIPVGTLLAGLVAPALFNAMGDWRSIWWFSLLLEAIAVVWMLACVKMPLVPENTINDGDTSKAKKPQKSFMLAGIMMSVAFFFWAYVYVDNINQMYPTYLQEVMGLDVTMAAMPTNLIALITIPFGIIVGIISDKLNCRKALLWIPYLVVSLIIFFLAFNQDGGMPAVWSFAVLMGLCASCIPTCTRSIIPVLVPEPGKTDLALTVMAFVTGLAQCCATFTTMSIGAFGWLGNAQFVAAPCALIACICVFIFAKNDKKVMKLRAEEQAD